MRLVVCFLLCLAFAKPETAYAFQTDRTGVSVEDTDSDGPNPEDDDSGSTKPEPSPAKRDVIYLPNKDGVLVAVPYNSKYEEYIDWISKQDALPIDQPYTISSVTISGEFFRSETGKEYVAASVELRLTIHTDTWIQIPLEMGELIVGENVAHEGSGDFVFDRRDAVQGMIWWAEGKGKHKLKLKGYIPVRRDVTTRRMSLKVPKTLVNELKIVVRDSGIELVNIGEVGVHSLTQNGSDALIESKGDIERFDVSWKPVVRPSGQRNFVESQATFLLTETNDSFGLSVGQRLASLQGAFRTIEVRLPSQFELIDVNGDELESYRVGKNPKELILDFRRPIANPIDLNWRFRASEVSNMTKLTIDGLDIQGTDLETGEILISSSSDRQLLPVQIDSETVVKKRVESRSTQSTFSSGYRFLKQPFQLDLSIVELQPEYTLQPEYFLVTEENRVTLDIRLRIQMIQGQLDRLQFNWPVNDTNQWEIDSFLMSASGTRFNKTDDGSYEILLDKPVSGQQTIVLRAIRKGPLDRNNYQIDLPVFDNTVSYPAVVAVGDRLNSQTSPTNDQDAIVQIDSEEGFERFDWIPNRDRFRLQFFELRPDPERNALELKTKIYTQEIDAVTHVEAIVEDSMINVVQRLELRVEKETLAQLRIQLPRSTNTQIQLLDDTETVLSSTVFELEKQRIADLRFQPSLLGRKTVVVRYHLPISEYDEEGQLPIATIVGHQFAEVDFRVDANMKTEYVAIIDATNHPSWAVQLMSNGDQQFKLKEHVDSIPLEIQSKRNSRLVVLENNRLTISSQVTQGRICYSTVKGVLLRPVDQLIFELPDDAEGVTISIPGNDQIPLKRITEDQNRVSFKLPTTANDYPLPFQLNYQQTVSTFGVVGCKVNTAIPMVFGAGNLDVHWQFRLPVGEHLLAYEQNLQPQFHWAWKRFGWRRTNFGIEQSIPFEQSGAAEGVPRYNFRVVSSATSEISIRTIRQSTLLLFGAGAGLIIGLVISQLFSLIGGMWVTYLLVCLSLGGMLFEQATIFLQPIALGMFLSMIAFAINKRRYSIRHHGRMSTVAFGTSTDQQDPSNHSIWKPSEVPDVGRTDSTQTHAPVLAASEVPVESSSQLEDSVS